MNTVTETTGNYLLQPSLTEMHNNSHEWISLSLLWKRELLFFQKLLDRYAPKFFEVDDKKKIDHFQSLITYYSGELVDEQRKKLREHESRLTQLLQEKNESDSQYFQQHKELVAELQSFSNRYNEFKRELFDFIETVM